MPYVLRYQNNFSNFDTQDYFKVKNHKGKKWILWSGNDCNPKYNKRYHIVLSINDLKIEKNLSLSNLVNEHFNKMKISYYNLNESKFNNYKLDFIPIENKTFVFTVFRACLVRSVVLQSLQQARSRVY